MGNHSPQRSRVVEQGNLLGGADLVTWSGRGAKRRQRTLTVDGRWKVGFAAALALVVEHGKRVPQDLPATKRCPRCGCRGRLEEDFGVRVMHGERKAQSWCRDCRAHVSSPKTQLRQEALSLGG